MSTFRVAILLLFGFFELTRSGEPERPRALQCNQVVLSQLLLHRILPQGSWGLLLRVHVGHFKMVGCSGCEHRRSQGGDDWAGDGRCQVAGQEALGVNGRLSANERVRCDCGG
jgi:hypothetical protein